MIVGLTTRTDCCRPRSRGRGGGAACREGGLVAFPTETVYGLGADAGNAAAIARLYQAKGRPSFNPLIAHVGDLDAARQIARFDARALGAGRGVLAGTADPGAAQRRRTARWPISPPPGSTPSPSACRPIRWRGAAAGVRRRGGGAVGQSFGPCFADHRCACAERPRRAASTSSSTAARSRSASNPPSSGASTRRCCCVPAALPREAIERVLGCALVQPPADPATKPTQPLAPGMLASHYAPRTPVRLDATSVAPGDALLAFGAGPVAGVDAARAVMNLSERGDLAEAAANLFGHLRALDALGARGIAVMPVPHHGLGEAINDRLRRAAVPQHELQDRAIDTRNHRASPMNIVQPPPSKLSPELIARFRAIVGDKYAVTEPADVAPYVTEDRNLFHGTSPLVLRPGSTAEVAAICRLANETRTALVPQGGNTGLVGGQTPIGGEVVISMRRLDRIREVDTESNTMTAESRRGAAECADARRRGRPAVSAVARRRGQLHHRRQSVDQCRRHRRAGLRRGARDGARARGGAGRRPHSQRPVEAEKGQYRLRPAQPLHRRRRHPRHHHRRDAETVSEAARGGDRLCRAEIARGCAEAARHLAHRGGGHSSPASS